MKLYKFNFNGETYTYNDGDSPIWINGEKIPAAPISRGEYSYGLDNSTLLIKIPINLPPFDRVLQSDFIVKIDVTITRYPEDIIEFKGAISQTITKFDKGVMELNAEPFVSIVSLKAPNRFFSPDCTFDLFDEDCGLNKNDYLVNIKTSDIDKLGPTQFRADIFGNYEDGYFRWGAFSTDLHESILIKEHKDDIITLFSDLKSFEDSSFINVLPGCNKTLNMCKNKYNNQYNFGGFPYIPGINPIEVFN